MNDARGDNGRLRELLETHSEWQVFKGKNTKVGYIIVKRDQQIGEEFYPLAYYYYSLDHEELGKGSIKIDDKGENAEWYRIGDEKVKGVLGAKGKTFIIIWKQLKTVNGKKEKVEEGELRLR